MEERKEPRTQPVEPIAKEIPETPEVKEGLEEIGMKSIPTQFTAKVKDPSTGKPMITSPATQTTTITLPAKPSKLLSWSKGSPSNSLTWFAQFWLRLIKKALHFGWRMVMKKPTK